jgi:hypothetical protein
VHGAEQEYRLWMILLPQGLEQVQRGAPGLDPSGMGHNPAVYNAGHLDGDILKICPNLPPDLAFRARIKAAGYTGKTGCHFRPLLQKATG